VLKHAMAKTIISLINKGILTNRIKKILKEEYNITDLGYKSLHNFKKEYLINPAIAEYLNENPISEQLSKENQKQEKNQDLEKKAKPS
jgi:hypothetical protein